MDKQEIFNTVVTHLRQQGKQSMSDEGKCLYRFQVDCGNVLMCAVGCLIKPEHYSEILEDNNAEDPNVIKAISKSLGIHAGKVPVAMLYELQNIHDELSVENWEIGFADVARTYALTVPPKK